MKGFSPFAIALYRRRIQSAKSIFDIATAQHEPEDHDSQRRRYALNEYEDSDDEMDGESDELNISSDLVDDMFTIDNITALPKSVESKISGMLIFEHDIFRDEAREVARRSRESRGRKRRRRIKKRRKGGERSGMRLVGGLIYEFNVGV